MKLLAELVVMSFACWGHVTIWTTFVNRLHATTLSNRWLIIANFIGLGSLSLLPPLFFGWLLGGKMQWWSTSNDHPFNRVLWKAYFACAAIGLAATVWRMMHRVRQAGTGVVRHESATRHDMVKRLGGYPPGRGLRSFLSRLPRNECFQLEVTEKKLAIPGLPAALDGLSIAHLSDLHFTQAFDRKYLREVVEISNGFDADLVVVTGDVIDRAHCVPWLPETIGQLQGRYGSYFIFGNHDVRLKAVLADVRKSLIDCGLQYVGRRCLVKQLEAGHVLIAGNELPWIEPAADMRAYPVDEDAPNTLRLLLSHSPDQYVWARKHGFDLMLAGHNHGGQIRLPIVGPLFSPSRYGVRYSGGTFFEPPTVLHVSRGISALDPVRYNCPPELARLVLRSPVIANPRAEQAKPAVLAGDC